MAWGEEVISEVITVLAAIVIIARLLTYHRGAGRHRPGVALVAWLLIVIATCVAFYGPPPGDMIGPITTIGMAWLALALIRTGGNVARLGRHPGRQ